MADVQFFKDVLNSEILRLTNLFEKWEDIALLNTIPEDIHGKILSVTGQCKLLINDKLQQFKDLIKTSSDTKPKIKITIDDLQGFWDLVNLQIEDISRKFEYLDMIQMNNWEVIDDVQKPICPNVLVKPKKQHNSNNNKNHSQAAKLRLAAAKLQLQTRMTLTKNDYY